MEPYTTELSPARLRREAVKGDLVNVAVLQPMDDELIPIDIPLDKGLFGIASPPSAPAIRAGWPRCETSPA